MEWDKYVPMDGKMDRHEDYRPWACNRVKLQVPENKPDYIKASPITLSLSDPSQPPLHYMAMQQPTEPSVDRVWRMIAEQTSPSASVVIAQLDDSRFSDDEYFHTSGGNAAWNFGGDNIWGDNWKAHLTFNLREVIAHGAIEKRMLVLRVYKEGGEKETRVILHFLYRRWHDFGVPTGDDLDSLLQLIELSKQHSALDGKRIIHCSAGVGRTGCFIALDHLIRELNFGVLERYDVPSESPDLVYNAANALDQQRSGMIQNELQYGFIYQVTRKLWHNKYGVVDEKAGNHK
ncbi:protein-tyrosine phosphatase-like protein [Trichoderma compactum]